MKHIYYLLFFLIANQTLYSQQATALNFDGVDDVVNCGNPSALDITGTNLTLETIITLASDGTIISKEQSNAAGFILRRDADGKLSFFIGSSGNWYGVSTATNAISSGIEYHIAATYDGANLKLYIDGVEAANTATTAAITSSASDLTIGDWPLGGRNINATIDDIRIWNVTRTAAEINANMQSDLSLPQTGLVAYYKFNQGTANATNTSETTLLDTTTNALNGTLSNFSLTGNTSNWIVTSVNVPTTTYTTQIYTGDDKDLTALEVTGSAIQWYAASTGGSALPATTLLVDGTTYYASQTIGGLESTTRLAITVNRISDNTQTYNTGATVANLVSTPSTGATAQWFSTASGGTALATTDALAAGTYYVEEQTATTIETLGSGFNNPFGVAEQSDGKILVTDSNNSAIKRMNTDGTSIGILGSGFSFPRGASIQTDGKILVADTGSGTIKRMDADGTSIEILGSGFSLPSGVAVQSDGKILVADTNNNAIKRMNADGTNIEILGSGFNQPFTVAVQTDGKILVTDTANSSIKRMNADGTGIETLGSGFSFPRGVSVQTNGKILVADNGNSLIKRMNADGTGLEILGSGFSFPIGVAEQSNGKILVADSDNNAIKRITEAYTSNRVAVTVEQQVTVVPTTIYPTQIYTGGNKDLTALQVTGTSIQWYAASTGGSALPATTLLVDGTTYYASQTIGGLESTTRLAITVNRISDNTQTYNTGATVANLVSTPSTGATAQWFTTSSGGTALATTDALSSGTYYIEEQTLESTETLGTGFFSPGGVAVQSDGKILVGDSVNNAIKRMGPDGLNVEVLATGLNSPTDLTVQSDGKILIIDNTIIRMDADGSNIETLGTGFFNPRGVAVQSDGKILVADRGSNTVKRMDADFSNIVTLAIGFNQPFAVAVQSDGKILVADRNNNVIKRMDADGSNIETLGTGFLRPSSVAVQLDGKILVADTNNSAIKRMNANGSNIVSLGTGFNFPTDVTVQSDGKILVADTNNNAIKRITEAYVSNRVAVVIEQTPTPVPTTIYTTQIYTGDNKDLTALQVTGTSIQWYAASTGGSALATTTLLVDGTTYYASQTIGGLESTARLAITVNRISDNTQTYNTGATVADLASTPSTDATIQWFSTASGGTALATTDALAAGTYYVEEVTATTVETLNSSFNFPYSIAVQADGKVLVVDTFNNAIKRIDADGTNIETLGTGFNQPTSVAVQVDGKILVTDTNNGAIKRMDTDGTNIEILTLSINTSSGIAVQADGKILVADILNGLIRRMDDDGSNLEILASGFNIPIGIAVQSDGKILVADSGNNAIKRMDADGSNIVTLGIGFNQPISVAVQPDGKILVADTSNNVIKRMDADGANITTLSSVFNNPRGIAVQLDGKILVADTGNNAMKRITEAATSNRVPVIVEQQVTAAPTTSYATQIYTGDNKDLTALQVTGSTIQWYAAATGGSALSNTALLTDGTTYYASQTVGGVESTTRLAVIVNRISDNTQTYTAGDTVVDLVSTPSTGATAQWFTTSSGGTALATTDALNPGTYYVEEQTPESVETLGTGFNTPSGLAIQSDGKILVVESATNTIKRMDVDGSNIEILATGFSGLNDIVVQSDGKILVSDYNIKRIDADGSNIETLVGSGLLISNSIAVQSDGKILVADINTNTIKRMDADGSNIVTLGTGFNEPSSLAVQSDGKILVLENLGVIKRMDADGLNIETIISGGFTDITIHDGKILVSDSGDNVIKRMDLDGSNIEILGSNFFIPSSVIVQPNGEILLTDLVGVKRIIGPGVSNRVAVTISSTLSVDAVNLHSSIVVYPNPVKDKLVLLNDKNLSLQKLDIYDVAGRLVQTFSLKNIERKAVLDVSKLSSGNYLIVILGEEGKITKKMIKK